MKENLKFSTAFILIFLISSCSSFSFYKVPVTQGNIFEEEDIEKLQVGQSMDQVQFILGSPMIKDPFHSNRWDYLNLITVGDEKIVEKKQDDIAASHGYEIVDRSSVIFVKKTD